MLSHLLGLTQEARTDEQPWCTSGVNVGKPGIGGAEDPRVVAWVELREGCGVDADEDGFLRYAGAFGGTGLQEWFQKGSAVTREVSVLVHSLEAISAEGAQMRVDAGADNRDGLGRL